MPSTQEYEGDKSLRPSLTYAVESCTLNLEQVVSYSNKNDLSEIGYWYKLVESE